MTQTSERVPVYTPAHPAVPDSDELRARIPGWGADLNKEDRPSVPKLKFLDTGAHWDFPERQPEKRPRERSIEHRFLTPVFGTAQPPSGLSGVMRKFAYRFSEGRAAHWLILLYADRVDAAEHHLRSTAELRGRTTRSQRPVSKPSSATRASSRGSGASGSTSSTRGWTRSSSAGRGSSCPYFSRGSCSSARAEAAYTDRRRHSSSAVSACDLPYGSGKHLLQWRFR